MMELLGCVFGSYICTLILTGSSLFKPLREKLKKKFPLRKHYPHPLECRLCIGLWISLCFWLFSTLMYLDFLIIYGLSYFLATLETEG